MTAPRPARRRGAAGGSKRQPRHIEEQNQRAFFSAAQMVYLPAADDIEPGSTLADYAYHPPMGGKRDRFEAHNLRRQGVKGGVSDIHVAIARCGGHGLWLELKATYEEPPGPADPPGKRRRKIVTKPTDSQKQWLRRMARAGYWTAIAWTWEDAIALCKAYLQGNRREMVGLDRQAGTNLLVAEPGDTEAWP